MKPLTMSEEQERACRDSVAAAPTTMPAMPGLFLEGMRWLLAEVDALRAKLAEADAGWTAASAMYGAERDRAEASESLAAEAVRLLRRINDDATPSEPEDGSFAASRERYFAALTESRAFLARADVAALTKGENDGHE